MTEDVHQKIGLSYEKIDQLIHAGRHQEALPEAQQAVELARQTYGERHAEYARGLGWLGTVYNELGNFSQAEPCCQQALDIIAEVAGKDHPDYALALNNLAAVCVSKKDYDRAETLIQEAIVIRRVRLGTDDPAYASSLNSLATIYGSLGEYDKAEPLLREAVNLAKRSCGDHHWKYGMCLANLAELCRLKKNFEEAESLFRQALDVRGDSAAIAHNLALLYESTGRPEEASAQYERAVSLQREAGATEHPGYLQSLDALARLNLTLGRLDKAEPLLVEGLALAERSESSKDISRHVGILSDLARLYHVRGEYQRAETIWKQVESLLAASVGDAHPDYARTLQNIAGLYLTMDEFSKAEALAQKGLDIIRNTLSKNSPEYAYAAGNLAAIFFVCGRRARSKALYSEVIAISEAPNGNIQEAIAETLSALASQCHQLGDYDHAERLLTRATEIRRALVGDQHPSYLNSRRNLDVLQDSIRSLDRIKTNEDENVPAELRTYTRCFNAFLRRDYSLCLRHAQGSASDNWVGNLLLLIVMSLIRLGRDREANAVGRKALEMTAAQPLINSHLRITLGELDGSALVARCDDNTQRIQAHYYTGARLLQTGSTEAARAEFEACLNLNATCLESAMARQDLAALIDPPTQPALIDTEKRIEDLQKQAAESFRDGGHDRALDFARQARILAKTHLSVTHPSYADTLLVLAQIYDNTGGSEKTDILLPRALEILHNSLGEGHPDYRSTLEHATQRCMRAFSEGGVEHCIRRTLSLVSVIESDSALGILLATLQAYLKADRSKALAEEALEATAHHPAHHALVKVALGHLDAKAALALTQTNRQRCQAHFFAGVHLESVGQSAAAGREYDECIAIGVDCADSEQAKKRRDMLRSPGTGSSTD
ncbi:MAG: tetratricopeptide repeat protein [Nitrospirae bacterium]|nr:tetratricopeptide repeat protein [Nitrospirota bacterium]